MRTYCLTRLQWLAFAALCVLAVLPVKVIGQTLNDVSLGDTYEVVMAKRGLPHYIGPAIENANDINNILNPSPQASVIESIAPDGASMPAVNMNAGSSDPNEIIKVPKGRANFFIWLYEGLDKNKPDPSAGFCTYVVFNRESGVVTDVLVWLTDPGIKKINIQKPGKISIGNTFADLLDNYGYPKPYRKIGPYMVCPYLNNKITFSVNSKNGKIVGIAIGKRALTVLPAQTDGTSPEPGTADAGTSSAPSSPDVLAAQQGQATYKR